jgi:hypothetical protein
VPKPAAGMTALVTLFVMDHGTRNKKGTREIVVKLIRVMCYLIGDSKDTREEVGNQGG